MKILHTNGSHADFVSLCNELDQYLNELVGGEENRSAYIPYNRLDNIDDVFVAYEGEEPVGCAALKEFEPGTAEVKRVFVTQGSRGKGVAEQLMEALEKEAVQRGYRTLVVQTGAPLVAAMGLYYKFGYRVIERYGPYAYMEDSICMGKQV